jgi:hypothetical protein
MPRRKQEDCSNGKIYMILSNNPDIQAKYIGSTIQTLAQRMAGHRRDYKRWLNGSSHSCSIYNEFQKYGIDQFHIELIEDYPCEREENLHSRENVFIRSINCVNQRSAFLTVEENKQYRMEIISCECGCEIRRNNRSKHIKSKKHLKRMAEIN